MSSSESSPSSLEVSSESDNFLLLFFLRNLEMSSSESSPPSSLELSSSFSDFLLLFFLSVLEELSFDFSVFLLDSSVSMPSFSSFSFSSFSFSSFSFSSLSILASSFSLKIPFNIFSSVSTKISFLGMFSFSLLLVLIISSILFLFPFLSYFSRSFFKPLRILLLFLLGILEGLKSIVSYSISVILIKWSIPLRFL